MLYLYRRLAAFVPVDDPCSTNITAANFLRSAHYVHILYLST